MIRFAVKGPPTVFLYYACRNYNIPNKYTAKYLKVPSDEPAESEVWHGERIMLENVFLDPILGEISFSLESGNVYNPSGQLEGGFMPENILKLGSDEFYITGFLGIDICINNESIRMNEFIVLIHLRGNMYRSTIEIVENNINEREYE